MTPYTPKLLSIAILDHHRPQEMAKLFQSLAQYMQVPVDVVYCHDGPNEKGFEGFEPWIDTLIVTSKPRGCGIATRQLFQACMTPYILYCQVDQYLVRPFTQEMLDKCVSILSDPTTFYVDLAGDQGGGRPSERALLMRRKDYLNIPGIDDVIGGPGPYADHRWTEQHLQEHMAINHLRFATARPHFFADNGKWSRRSYPCGGMTRHATDEKTLFIEKPLKQRYDFPNLKLNDAEWAEVLEGCWPTEGRIPEADKASSFKVEGWS